MKRLAIVTSHPIQYIAPLFQWLQRRGAVEIKVFYTWTRGAETYDQDFGKKVTWDIPLLNGYDYAFAPNEDSPRRDFWGVKNPGLEKAIEAWGAEAVLVIGWNYYSHLRTMRHFKGKIPVLFRGDSTMLDEKGLWQKIGRRFFLRWVYRHVDYALYVGSRNKDYYLAHGLRENQLVFAPHAIDNDRFGDRDGSYQVTAAGQRAELDVPRDHLLVVFVGKFQKKKDPLLLVNCWKTLPHQDLQLLLVGDGELETEIRTAAGEDRRIHILPFQNQSVMPVVYRIGDVFCLPSQGPGETWGLAVNEAMACARPVLVSDRCGCAPDLVRNGENGFIFAAGNEQELHARIVALRDQKNRLPKMGEASASIIRDWSYLQLASAVEKVMSGL